MKTIEIKLYSFDELSDEAKQKAIEKLSDINVKYDWWNTTYEDAENVGLKITAFDIDRASYVHGEFIFPAIAVSAKIIQEHGKDCATHKTALKFSADYDVLVAKYSDGIDKTKVTYENEDTFNQESGALENDFLNSLCEDYLKILRDDYEYQTSEEAIIEMIIANKYDFTEDGKLY